ncbi:hypothetical protein SAMN04488529_1101, partial [Clostridium gasigenes]
IDMYIGGIETWQELKEPSTVVKTIKRF